MVRGKRESEDNVIIIKKYQVVGCFRYKVVARSSIILLHYICRNWYSNFKFSFIHFIRRDYSHE